MPHILLIVRPGNRPDLTKLKEMKQDFTKLWVLKMDESQHQKAWWSPCPGGWRTSLGGRETPQSNKQTSSTPNGPFSGQNHINKKLIQPKYSSVSVYVVGTVRYLLVP
jgi:hypothetical protein